MVAKNPRWPPRNGKLLKTFKIETDYIYFLSLLCNEYNIKIPLPVLIFYVIESNLKCFNIFPRSKSGNDTEMTGLWDLYRPFVVVVIFTLFLIVFFCQNNNAVQRTLDHENTSERLRYLDEFVLDSVQKRESVAQLLNFPIINNFNIEFQVNQYNKCLSFDPELIIITPSHIANFGRRNQTRLLLSRFMKNNSKTAVHVFVVGRTEDETLQQKLEEEMTKYNDIVQTK